MAKDATIDERALTKMEIRKLEALRRSIGEELGTKAFLEWLRRKPTLASGPLADRTAEAIAAAVEGLLASRAIDRLPRGGYLVKRGRGRVIVERPA